MADAREPDEGGSDLFERWLSHRQESTGDAPRPRTYGVPRTGLAGTEADAAELGAGPDAGPDTEPDAGPATGVEAEVETGVERGSATTGAEDAPALPEDRVGEAADPADEASAEMPGEGRDAPAPDASTSWADRSLDPATPDDPRAAGSPTSRMDDSHPDAGTTPGAAPGAPGGRTPDEPPARRAPLGLDEFEPVVIASVRRSAETPVEKRSRLARFRRAGLAPDPADDEAVDGWTDPTTEEADEQDADESGNADTPAAVGTPETTPPRVAPADPAPQAPPDPAPQVAPRDTAPESAPPAGHRQAEQRPPTPGTTSYAAHHPAPPARVTGHEPHPPATSGTDHDADSSPPAATGRTPSDGEPPSQQTAAAEVFAAFNPGTALDAGTVARDAESPAPDSPDPRSPESRSPEPRSPAPPSPEPGVPPDRGTTGRLPGLPRRRPASPTPASPGPALPSPADPTPAPGVAPARTPAATDPPPRARPSLTSYVAAARSALDRSVRGTPEERAPQQPPRAAPATEPATPPATEHPTPGAAEATAAPAASAYDALRAQREAAAPPLPDVLPPSIDFRPRTLARRVTSVLLLVGLVATGLAGWRAYDSRIETDIGLAAILALATGIVWAVRAGSVPTRVRLHGGVLEVRSQAGRFVFEVTGAHTRLETVGTPGRRGSRLLVHRRGLAPFALTPAMVDLRELVEALRYYRPEL